VNDFPSRLRDALWPDEPPAPTIEDARRAIAHGRARRRRTTAVTAMAVVVLVAAGAALVASPTRPSTVVTARPGPDTTTTATPTSPAPAVADERSALPPPTTVASAVTASTSSQRPVATSTPPKGGDPSKGPDGPGPGFWMVGLDGKGLRQVSPDEGPVAWSPDSRVVAKAAGDTIWLFPTAAGERIGTLPVESPSARCLDWSSKGELAWVTSAGELRVSADLKTSRILATDVGGRCTWSHDGALIAAISCCSSQQPSVAIGLTILNRQGDVVGRRPSATLTDWFGNDKIAWAPDDLRIAVMEGRSDGKGPQVLIVDLAGGETTDQRVAPSESSSQGSVAWSADGKGVYVQSSGSQYLVTIPDLRSTRLPLACCRSVSALPDGRLLALGSVPAANFTGYHRAVTVIEPDLTTTRNIVVARGPQDGPAMSECAGSYIVGKWISPDARSVAFSIRASWGPRCDSPVFL
jgi:hypothetical protein